MRSENIEIKDLPSRLSEASKSGSLFYFTGRPCKRGHTAPRYTSTGQCVVCQEGHYRKKTKHSRRPTKKEYLGRARKLAKERGGKCLSTEYLTAKAHLIVTCGNSGHPTFKISYDNLKQGKWCPECKADRTRGDYKYSIDDMRRIAKERGGKCLSNKFLGVKRKLKWTCETHKHPDFLATPDNVIQGKWCPQCGEEKKGRELRPVEDVLEIINERGGELVCFIGDYRGYETRTKVKCADGHTWSPTVHSLLNGSWCPKCLDSIGEIITRKIFEATYGLPFPKTRPDFLISEKGGRLELDGYNAGMRLAFEYQGPYHKRPDQIERDNNKRQLCLKKGITIVEVPYLENPYPPENVLKIVTKEIQKINPGRTVILPNDDFFSKKLEKLRKVARSRDGSLLSNIYLGSKQKLLWKCGNLEHPPWKATPESILRSNSWCPSCAKKAYLKKNAPLLIIRLTSFGRTHGLTLISKEYRGVRKAYDWKCENGHIVKRTKAGIIKSAKRGRDACTICAGTSKRRYNR